MLLYGKHANDRVRPKSEEKCFKNIHEREYPVLLLVLPANSFSFFRPLLQMIFKTVPFFCEAIVSKIPILFVLNAKETEFEHVVSCHD